MLPKMVTRTCLVSNSALAMPFVAKLGSGGVDSGGRVAPFGGPLLVLLGKPGPGPTVNTVRNVQLQTSADV